MNNMNLNIKYFCIILLLFIVCVFIFYRFNNDKRIIFSHESGFYDEQFYLDIKPTNKNLKIYYTTDCTRPTPKSTEYKEPILIKDATKNKNVYSAREDISGLPIIKEDFIGYPTKRKLNGVAPFLVDKAFVLRVGVYDKFNNFLSEYRKIYFIDFNKKKGYSSLPVVSVVFEPEDLFNPKSGIYVLGENFLKIKGNQGKYLSEANFASKGEIWEKTAYVDVFDKNRNLNFSKTLIAKIKGQMSRYFPQKSLTFFDNLKEKDLYILDYNFNNKVVLDTCSTDVITKLADYLIQNFENNAKSKFTTLNMIPCVMFLNGEYWGVYYLTDDLNVDYLSKKYNLSNNNIFLIEKDQNKTNSMNKEDEYIISANIADEQEYKKVCEIIDIDSFIDYFATEIYVANTDWIFGNFYYWKTLNKNNKLFADKKRRYVLYDLNYKTTLKDYEFDTVKLTVFRYPIFHALLRNKEFREKFRKRMYQLENEIYTPQNVNTFINEYLKLMKEPLEKNNERFYDIINYDLVLQKEINKIKTFIEKRPEYINKYMEECFKDYE